ncbi:lipoprotein insertase outer membrane protein LolB [Thalassotalea fonticola]|uniref:Outer-membrane lipoprotein LolB n=1 Tax=Thalassotalea fonticola TaxID=3065649 RepID=A0ABZ0GPX1_9GAMM|nr:lipoprotein insertase outer membrane protein LolB [Colwelliaceae bacterium S1-1]
MLKHSKNSPVTLMNALIFILVAMLTACSTTKVATDQQLFQNKTQRAEQLSRLHNWTIKGKIAFIEGNSKQSANLYWRQTQHSTNLKLTTFLGVNVLTLSSKNDIHILTANGKTYQDDNLEDLLNQVSGIRLPVNALVYWIKGLKAQNEDQITYSETTLLPQTLNAWVNNTYWQLHYKKYNLVNNLRLASQLTIKHQQLVIKMAIHTWEIN